MKPQIVSCAMAALALGISVAFADEIKPADGTGIATPDTTVAGPAILGDGLMPDGRECIVGTTPDCVAKDAKFASKIIGNGVMPDGRVCILRTTPDCGVPRNALAAGPTIGE